MASFDTYKITVEKVRRIVLDGNMAVLQAIEGKA